MNCEKHYVFFSDSNEILSEGCELDIPLFDNRKPIVCSSYTEKRR